MKALFLVVASVFFSLILFEAGLRMFTSFTGSSATPSVTAPVADKPVNVQEAMGYVDQIATAPGTDRQWFAADPPPLPNRAPVKADQVARYNDYKQRGLFPDQADYFWNRYYVESTRCAPNSLFKNYPEKVLVFDPPTPTSHPFFRFRPNTTGVAGLVTNEFGLRGPPLTLPKPRRTIRIAFIGASTTVGFHHFAFSYPEYVTYWLNRFAESNYFDVRFEGLNAGREGINSRDIAAIVRDELRPLEPDLAVYNGGGNQFPSANQLVSPRIPPRQKIDPNDPLGRHVVPQPIRTHLALGDLVDRALNRFSAMGEPRKPAYRLRWPHGVDEQNPDVDRSNLPLELPVIIKDLNSIGDSLKSIDGQLMVSSLELYANDVVPLSPVRHRFIYEQLNTLLWPLRYADIHRLVNFHNRVLRRYAMSRDVTFLDVASQIPQDPNLFVDAFHMTETGDRLKAWIVFQKLAPLLRRKIESGELPRSPGSHFTPPAPSLAASEMSIRCEDRHGPLTRVGGALSLDSIQVHNNAVVQKGPPLKVISPAEQWAFAAEVPIHAPTGLPGRPFLYLRGQVVKGQVSVGILDDQTGEFQMEKGVAGSPGPIDIYMPILFPSRASGFVIRNAAEGNVRSELLIHDVSLVFEPKEMN